MSDPVVRKDELEAAVEARRELGREFEPELVEAFVERIEKRLEARGAREPAAPRWNPPHIGIVLGSLGISIPLMAIAGGIAGLTGIALVCVAIVIVNVLARF